MSFLGKATRQLTFSSIEGGNLLGKLQALGFARRSLLHGISLFFIEGDTFLGRLADCNLLKDFVPQSYYYYYYYYYYYINRKQRNYTEFFKTY
jgi:hypothetical protein